MNTYIVFGVLVLITVFAFVSWNSNTHKMAENKIDSKDKMLLKTSWYLGLIAFIGGWTIFLTWCGGRYLLARDFEDLEMIGFLWILGFFWLCVVALMMLLAYIFINRKNPHFKMLGTGFLILVNIPSVLLILRLQADIENKVFVKLINKSEINNIELKLQGDHKTWNLGKLNKGSSKVFNYAPPYWNNDSRLYQEPDTLNLIMIYAGNTDTIGFPTLNMGVCEQLILDEELKIESPSNKQKDDNKPIIQSENTQSENNQSNTVDWLDPLLTKQLSQTNTHDSIEIYGLPITDIPKLIYEYPNIRYLRIDCTSLDCMKSLSGNIRNFKHLETLIISKSALRELPKEIGELRNLKKLIVAGGGQIESIPEEISNLSELEEIDLWRNNLTEITVDLSKLSKLEKLYLGENKFTKSYVESLSQKYPEIEIELDYVKD